jgi:MFS family permease
LYELTYFDSCRTDSKTGFTESIIPTAFMAMVSGYYTQSEQALRQSWWFSGTGWFIIIGGALNYGFAQIEGGNLAPWQYIYVFAGCLTALFGIWCFFVPDSPLDAWFLTPDERIAAVERLRAGQTGVKTSTLKLSQMKEAALDVKIWLVAITMAAAWVSFPYTSTNSPRIEKEEMLTLTF